MNMSNYTIATKLAAYEKLYTAYAPTKTRSLGYKIHRLVGLLIEAHFKKVWESHELIELVGEFEKFLRELRVEFDLIYTNLDEHSYPKFVEALTALKTNGDLKDYHQLVVELLKFLLFAVENEQLPVELEEISMFLQHNIEGCSPEKRAGIKLEKTETLLRDTISNDGIDTSHNKMEEYVKRQIDIALDS